MSWIKYWKVQNVFSSSRKRNLKFDKDGYENIVTISYKIKFIGNARFMTIIPDKIFGTNWSNPVKLGRKRKVGYLFLRVF